MASASLSGSKITRTRRDSGSRESAGRRTPQGDFGSRGDAAKEPLATRNANSQNLTDFPLTSFPFIRTQRRTRLPGRSGAGRALSGDRRESESQDAESREREDGADHDRDPGLSRGRRHAEEQNHQGEADDQEDEPHAAGEEPVAVLLEHDERVAGGAGVVEFGPEPSERSGGHRRRSAGLHHPPPPPPPELPPPPPPPPPPPEE